MGRFCWRVGLGEPHNALGDVRSQQRDARWPRFVAQQTAIAFLHEALLPAPDASLRLASPAHDPIGANTIGAEQNDLGSPDRLVRSIAIPRQRLQSAGSAGFRVMVIPVRMHQTRMHPVTWESPPGFKCQTQSTRPSRNARTRCSNALADALLRNPTSGSAGCCARAASGHATVTPLSVDMNCRLPM